MEIKATDVKALREKTGAGMMDCKKALVQANGDFARAEKILKELGLAAAQKRAGRATREGRIFSSIQDGKGALLELTCETDFVAKNKEFVALGGTLASLAVAKGTGAQPEDFSSQVHDTVGRIKENITLRRLQVLQAGENDLLMDYIHGEGKIGVMVKFSLSDPSLKDNARVKEVAFDLTLHTAAFAPLFLKRDQVPENYLKEQEEIFTKQAEKLGKPENVVKGIVQGKMNKHLAEICFVDQPFVKDQNLTVSKVLSELDKETGGKVQIEEYLYYKVGEEIE
ncbi:MAG: elongation factor Ts [Spirochaetaceae bacterium]|nr:MAG: elongation factor Ts [Spirochaetaceae bacterium]